MVANVVAPGSVTGTTQILDGSTVLASSSGTTVNFQNSSLAVGTHALTASFAGDATHTAATSSTVNLTVSKATPVVSISTSANPSGQGQDLIIYTMVAEQAPGNGIGTGNVQFMGGSTQLGTALLSGSLASLDVSTLSAGQHSLTVVFPGDANTNSGTSATLIENITSLNNTPTTTTLTPSTTTPVYGQTVTFAVTVAAAGSSTVPAGTVQLMDGSNLVKHGVLDQNGAAQISYMIPSAGAHSLTAVYGGSSTLNGSSSSTLTLTASKADPAFQVTASANPATVGQVVTLTATAGGLATGEYPPLGTVQFMDGTNSLGGVSLSSFGTASLPVGSLAVGTHQITITYAGDTNFNSATSQPLALVVGSTAPVPHIDSVAGAGASFPPVTSLSSNAYVMVRGSNFAPTGTSHVLGSGDLDNGNLPTQLAGVCVTIGGASALITYVSPNQINLVTPDVPGNTTVNVQVTAGCDTATPLTSNLMPASTQASTPEFFYWVYNPNGQNPVVAVDNTTGAYVGAASLSQTFPNLTFTPASPGEILDIYGASFGPTNPSFDPGVAPTTAAQVTVTPVVTLGPITMNGADVLYAGVSPGTAGLYQLSIRVPAGLPDGDNPLVMTIDGISSAAGAFLTVKNQ